MAETIANFEPINGHLATAALSIVAQYWLLPAGQQSSIKITNALENRLPQLREAILSSKLKRYGGKDHWRKNLETEMTTNVGFIDEEELSYLVSDFGNFNPAHALMAATGIRSESFGLRTRSDMNNLYSMNDVMMISQMMMTKYFNPTAWMLQHQIISVLLHLRKYSLPRILSALSLWFKRQQERFVDKKGLVVFQLVAIQQWKRRMELIDSMIYGFLIMPVMLEDVVQSFTCHRNVTEAKAMASENKKSLPLLSCESMMEPFYKASYNLLRESRKGLQLRALCVKVYKSIDKIAATLDELNHIDIPSPTNRSTNHPQWLDVIINSSETLRRLLVTDASTMVLHTRAGLIALYTSVIRDDGESFTKLKKSLSQDLKTLPTLRNQQAVNRVIGAVKHLLTEVMVLATSAVLSCQNKAMNGGMRHEDDSNDESNLNVWRTLIYNMYTAMKQCRNISHYQAAYLQDMTCFDPWTTKIAKPYCECDIFVPDVIFDKSSKFASELLSLSQLAFRCGTMGKSQSFSSDFVALYIYRESIRASIAILLSFNASYMTEAYHADVVTCGGNQSKQIYHKRCCEMLEDIIAMKRTVFDYCVASVASSYGQQLVKDSKTMQKATSFPQMVLMMNIDTQCVVNYSDLLDANSEVNPSLTSDQRALLLRQLYIAYEVKMSGALNIVRYILQVEPDSKELEPLPLRHEDIQSLNWVLDMIKETKRSIDLWSENNNVERSKECVSVHMIMLEILISVYIYQLDNQEINNCDDDEFSDYNPGKSYMMKLVRDLQELYYKWHDITVETINDEVESNADVDTSRNNIQTDILRSIGDQHSNRSAILRKLQMLLQQVLRTKLLAYAIQVCSKYFQWNTERHSDGSPCYNTPMVNEAVEWTAELLKMSVTVERDYEDTFSSPILDNIEVELRSLIEKVKEGHSKLINGDLTRWDLLVAYLFWVEKGLECVFMYIQISKRNAETSRRSADKGDRLFQHESFLSLNSAIFGKEGFMAPLFTHLHKMIKTKACSHNFNWLLSLITSEFPDISREAFVNSYDQEKTRIEQIMRGATRYWQEVFVQDQMDKELNCIQTISISEKPLSSENSLLLLDILGINC